MGEPDFDFSQAASLLGDDPQQVDAEMAAIVLELVETSEIRLKDLKIMNPETQAREISALSHQIRGSLLNFGFTEVGTILLQIEKVGYTPPEFVGLVEKARSVFLDSKKMLAERYPSVGII